MTIPLSLIDSVVYRTIPAAYTLGVPKPPLAANITKFREDAGITQERLSTLSGIKQSAISKYERGSAQPEVPTLLKLAAGLGVSVERLVERVDERYDLACQTAVDDGTSRRHHRGGPVEPAQTRLLGEITLAYEKLAAEVLAQHGELGRIVDRIKRDPLGLEGQRTPKKATHRRRSG